MASETETYLKTNQVRERYGNCSAMWIERRMKDSGFPQPVYFGVLRFWRVSDLVVWDAEQIKAAPKPAHDISPAHTPQARAKARRTKEEGNRYIVGSKMPTFASEQTQTSTRRPHALRQLSPRGDLARALVEQQRSGK
ncbi:MAG: hypothetical protein P4M05_04725 [Bradyrhizobium sp.]|jgi:predicted DNA-binding transcriptional regulator AlpA|nr:hypothetical protein [Bradyrhizobium sp.]